MLRSSRASFFADHLEMFVKTMRSFMKKWYIFNPLLFDVAIYSGIRSFSHSFIIKMKKAATQASRSQRRTAPGQCICGNLFHSDWVRLPELQRTQPGESLSSPPSLDDKSILILCAVRVVLQQTQSHSYSIQTQIVQRPWARVSLLQTSGPLPREVSST